MAKSKRERALARARTRAAAREEKARSRLRDAGPDQGGNYSVNPYAARGHVVEVAPKELRANPNSQQFPKRIATQRMIDRYLSHGHITDAEYKAAEAVLRTWTDSGLEARVIGRYENDVPQGMRTHGAFIDDRCDGMDLFVKFLAAIPSKSRGAVRAVVVEDIAASDWARRLGYGQRSAKAHGMLRLKQGLQAIAVKFGY